MRFKFLENILKTIFLSMIFCPGILIEILYSELKLPCDLTVKEIILVGDPGVCIIGIARLLHTYLYQWPLFLMCCD